MVACGLCGLAVLACAGLLTAAVLVPAPAAVVPLIVAVSIGLPVLTAMEVPAALAVLRSGPVAAPLDHRALDALRSRLAELPETQHPRGF
jgi:hypothetical protein